MKHARFGIQLCSKLTMVIIWITASSGRVDHPRSTHITRCADRARHIWPISLHICPAFGWLGSGNKIWQIVELKIYRVAGRIRTATQPKVRHRQILCKVIWTTMQMQTATRSYLRSRVFNTWILQRPVARLHSVECTLICNQCVQSHICTWPSCRCRALDGTVFEIAVQRKSVSSSRS